MDTKLRIEQFEKFYNLLMSNAPKGYEPWFFPCEKQGKNPCPEAILKINRLSRGSWHHPSAKLTKEQCIEHIKQGYNIGISARTGDKLIIGDIDSPELLIQLPANTLTTTSRKRVGAHFFGWDKDGTAKINLPTDKGEIRSDNQYVLACGSYVPFNLSDKNDKDAYDELPETAKSDKLIGYYTLRDFNSPRDLTFEDFPQFFKDKQRENLEADVKIKQRDEFREKPQGKYTDLFNLKASDVVGFMKKGKREGHPFHSSDTDANFSMSSDGTLAHCWRHLVSLNAVQLLCVKAGYANCEDAGTPHKHRGVSHIKGDKKALEVAYEEAVKCGLIKPYEELQTKPKANYDVVKVSEEEAKRLEEESWKDSLYFDKDLKDYQRPQEEYLIDGLIPKGHIGLIVGNPQERKTFLMLYTALCGASGKDVFGMMKVPKKIKIFIIDEENGKPEIDKRIKSLKEGMGLNGENLEIAYLSFYNARLDQPTKQKRILSFIDEFKPDLIYVDCLQRVLSIDIDKENQKVSEFMTSFVRPIVSKYGCSFVFLHHYRKRDAKAKFVNPMDEIRGATELRNYVRFALGVQRPRNQDDPNSDMIILKTIKMSNAPAVKDKVISFNTNGTAISVKYEGEAEDILATEQLAANAIMEWIFESGIKGDFKTSVVMDASDVIGYKGTSLKGGLNVLVGEKKLEKVKRGVWKIAAKEIQTQTPEPKQQTLKETAKQYDVEPEDRDLDDDFEAEEVSDED